jgi:hypothetical protein
MKENETKDEIVNCMEKVLQEEVRKLCADDHDSIMLKSDTETIKMFSFQKILQEAEKVSPTLIKLLTSCLHSTRNQNAVLVAIISIIVKQRRDKMCLFQRVMSVILYGGNCSKMVFQRLNKLNICMCHKSTCWTL